MQLFFAGAETPFYLNQLRDLGVRQIAISFFEWQKQYSSDDLFDRIPRDMEVCITAGVARKADLDWDSFGQDYVEFCQANADGARVHVAFLSTTPPKTATEGLDRIIAQYPKRRDRYHLRGDTLYLHLPDGAAETKFTGKALDRILGGTGTARNWNTVLKLHAMSKR